MKRISIKAVIIGSITDIVVTNLFTFPLIIYVSVTHNLHSMPKDQISKALTQILHHDPVIYSIQVLLGAIASVLGGYVAGRIAKHDEILNGTLAAFLCVGSGLYALFFSSTSMHPLHYIFGFISSPVFCAFGGYLRHRIVRRRSNA